MVQHEKFIPLADFRVYDESETVSRSAEFYNFVKSRRTVRHFSAKTVPETVIQNCIQAAGTAPSGANLQPWFFVAVRDQTVKQEIREAAEEEEREFYSGRAPEKWLKTIGHLGTDDKKPFLEEAPWLIAVFAEKYRINQKGEHEKSYYVTESVGLATGVLITALHHAGLVSLTHTPSPMGFLNEILDRPTNEKPFLLLVTGYPAEDAMLPNIKRKKLNEILTIK
ncbi:MAG: nitroreductase family protein [FCB group bacterium]|nr:nitroreductase family protein [FCB group bacterium]